MGRGCAGPGAGDGMDALGGGTLAGGSGGGGTLAGVSEGLCAGLTSLWRGAPGMEFPCSCGVVTGSLPGEYPMSVPFERRGPGAPAGMDDVRAAGGEESGRDARACEKKVASSAMEPSGLYASP
jgi:hypothetical protein